MQGITVYINATTVFNVLTTLTSIGQQKSTGVPFAIKASQFLSALIFFFNKRYAIRQK